MCVLVLAILELHINRLKTLAGTVNLGIGYLVLASLELYINRLKTLAETVNQGVGYLVLANTKILSKARTRRDYRMFYALIFQFINRK